MSVSKDPLQKEIFQIRNILWYEVSRYILSVDDGVLNIYVCFRTQSLRESKDILNQKEENMLFAQHI